MSPTSASPASPPDEGALRIGEVARRAGISVSTLRAWERRYGVLEPERSPGGHRLYSDDDVARVERMLDLIERGWSVSAAARHLSDPAAPPEPTGDGALDAIRRRIWRAFDAFDARTAHRALDDAFARFEALTVLDDIAVPLLRQLGEGWEEDPAAIAREHFGTHLLRSRLARMLRVGPGRQGGCVAYCPEDELHDVGLLMAAVALDTAGWRVHFLGAHTPSVSLPATIARVEPSLLLVAAQMRTPAEDFLGRIEPGADALVVLGGAGFRPADAERFARGLHYDGRFSDLPDAVAANV